MSRTLFKLVAVVVVFLAGSAWGFQKGSEKRSTYKDCLHGFSMDLPKFPGSGPKVTGMVITAMGPSDGKFSPNVNAVIQSTATTANAYADLSVGQIKQAGMKLNSQKRRKVSGRDAVEIDYEGSINGSQQLRFLSLSVIDKDRVVLVTCTVPPDSFVEGEAEYRACLDSLKID